ncbi:MAG: hypothetical protein AABW67_05265, partial [Nanoarchaeota archaeon]
AIDALPQTTYALFKKGTTPNFAGPPISRDELADRVKNCSLPKDKIEIMQFSINLNDSVVAKALNTKHSDEVPRMRI